MADYAKKKNDELATLCKERGLAHTGKKADLVKRLEDFDSNQSQAEVTGESTAASKDPEPEATGKAVDDTKAQGATAAAAAAEAKDPADTDATNGHDKPTEEKAPAQDFSLGLEDRTLDEEIEKRKKRAAKFGLDTSQDETLKQLERAKRFGTNNLPGLLNQALPERAERSRKRGREGKEGKEETDDRKRSRQRPAPEKKDDKAGFPSWMTAEDRAAAERRKAKFGAAK